MSACWPEAIQPEFLLIMEWLCVYMRLYTGKFNWCTSYCCQFSVCCEFYWLSHAGWLWWHSTSCRSGAWTHWDSWDFCQGWCKCKLSKQGKTIVDHFSLIAAPDRVGPLILSQQWVFLWGELLPALASWCRSEAVVVVHLPSSPHCCHSIIVQ